MKSIGKGVVGSVSIIACGLNFKTAATLIKSYPDTGIGVHLCLVQERPVLPSKDVPSIVTNDGEFYNNFMQFAYRFWSGRINLTDIERELEAQIEKVIESGITPSHLDSHQYVHLLPPVLTLVMKLAKKYNIKWIRYPVGDFRISLKTAAKMLWLSVFSRYQVSLLQADSIKYPTRSFGVFCSGCLDMAQIRKSLRNSIDGVNDITCHPGYFPENKKYAAWGYTWEKELSILTQNEIIDLIGACNLKLTNYAKEEIN